jgi:Cu-Zn family superoxide dismutase
MPNQYVPADRTLRAQMFNSQIVLDEAENGTRGRALMIHGGTEDYASQPSGDAGDRLACAVIE